jgi:predicted HTH transcriptional regulator
LPIIDANGGGVSVTACGCEKYMRLLRYGQYGQVGVDGVWRDKDTTKSTTKASNEALNEALDEALENKLLAEINNNPYIKQADLSKILNVSRATVQRMIKEKTETGVLNRIGGKRYGYWEVHQ